MHVPDEAPVELGSLRSSTSMNGVMGGELSITQLFALFLVAWWLPAVSILTFFSPFTKTSNAFFATWVATLTSILMLGATFTRVQVSMKSMMAVREQLELV